MYKIDESAEIDLYRAIFITKPRITMIISIVTCIQNSRISALTAGVLTMITVIP